MPIYFNIFKYNFKLFSEKELSNKQIIKIIQKYNKSKINKDNIEEYLITYFFALAYYDNATMYYFPNALEYYINDILTNKITCSQALKDIKQIEKLRTK